MRKILVARNLNYTEESDILRDFINISTELSKTVNLCSNIPWHKKTRKYVTSTY